MGCCLSKLHRSKVMDVKPRRNELSKSDSGGRARNPPKIRIDHHVEVDKVKLKNEESMCEKHSNNGGLLTLPGVVSTTALVTGVPDDSNKCPLSQSLGRLSMDESPKDSIEIDASCNNQPSLDLEVENEPVRESKNIYERKRSKSPDDKRSRSQPPMKDQSQERPPLSIAVESYSKFNANRRSSGELGRSMKMSGNRQMYQALNLESIVDKIIEQENESGGSSPKKSPEAINDNNYLSSSIHKFDPSFMKEDDTLQLNVLSKLGKTFYESPVGQTRQMELKMFNFGTPQAYDHSVIDLKRVGECQSRSAQNNSMSSGKRSYYRTCNKINLLTMKKKATDCLQLPYTGKNQRSKTADHCNQYSIDVHKNSRKNQDKSIVMDTRDDINRVDMSGMDISIRSVTNSRSNASKRLKSLQSRSNSRSQNKSCLLDEDKEPKLNTTLNTTYIKNIEMITPMKLRTLKDLDLKVEGMRTKINDYVLLKTIGAGGWSDQVYLAAHMITKEKFVGMVIYLGCEDHQHEENKISVKI